MSAPLTTARKAIYNKANDVIYPTEFNFINVGDMITIHRQISPSMPRKIDSGVVIQKDRHKVVIRFVKGIETFTHNEIIDKSVIVERGKKKCGAQSAKQY